MKYCLLSKDMYDDFNRKISEAKRYPDESGTLLYAPLDPDPNINGLYKLLIDDFVIENMTYLLTDVVLLEN